MIGHPFKYDTDRFGLERSEDALSWNVFRSIQEAGCLAHVAKQLTGQQIEAEPTLYLWGIRVRDDSFEPWNLLIQARERFESRLPVERPLTEPDIALHLPGHYLILIEAKFGSPNTFYTRGPRRDATSLTLDELLGIYHDPCLSYLDTKLAASVDRVPYQLWRNTVFAEWMAISDNPETKAYHINLVREGWEADVAHEFAALMHHGSRDRFRRATWESIINGLPPEPRLSRLRSYMKTKTEGLKQAFNL